MQRNIRQTLTVGPNTFGYCSVTRTGIFKMLATVLSKAMLFVTVAERYISDSNLTWTSHIKRAAVACLSRGIFTLRAAIARPTRQDEMMQKSKRTKRFKLLKFIAAFGPTRITMASVTSALSMTISFALTEWFRWSYLLFIRYTL